MTTFADLLTFTRSGSATYVDSTGTLQTAADGEPRIGHHVWDGSQWVNEGLLIESESRTNLFLNSGDFSGGNWFLGGSGSPTRSVVGGEQRISWFGGPGNILDTTSGPTPSAGETYTLSFRVKVVDLDGANPSNDFSLTLEDRDRTEGASNMPVTLVDNGEYLVCSVTHTFSAPSGIGMYIHFRYEGAQSPVLAIEYAQLEQGSTPSSYIPTSGSTVTRAAETLTAPSANLPWWTDNITYLSDNLVTNGTFDTDTDWTKGSGWTISGGTANANALSGSFLTQTGLGIVEGKVYLLEFDLVSRVSGRILPRIGEGSVYNLASVAVPGNYSFVVVGGPSDAVQFAPSPSFEGSIDNISVREIETPAVSIAMEGLETYADEDTAGQVSLYDRRVDANNRITLTLDTDSTKTGTFTLTLVNGGSTETISTTGEIAPGVNKPFNVAFVATSTELGIALNGTAETRVSHTLGLPDLSGADATYEGMGTRSLIREWADDVDEAEASS